MKHLLLLLILVCAWHPMAANGDAKDERVKHWSGLVLDRPVKLRLFTKPFSAATARRDPDDLRAKVDGKVVFGSFGGAAPTDKLSELWVTATWEIEGKLIERTERTFTLLPHFNDHDGANRIVISPSDSDESILVIVSCGDSVIERIAIRVSRAGKAVRYLLSVKS